MAARFGAMGLCVLAGFYPQDSKADGFTGKDFASWTEAGQDSFIQASVTMAGVVLSRVEPAKARCVDAWYSNENKSQRNASVRDIIKAYGDYHPSGTILAIIEQECGALN